ncbi:uncharacterized protein [Penaeus vannamei]|uniref:uncharacterized protein n=1 Tax=Penaeus vannamei TaxID=6689 RepID=UPI00387F8FF0
MFVIIKMLPFRVAPYLSLLLVLCGSALAQETEQPPTGLPPVFDIDFESTDAQLTGCPPDKVSFELVTGYVYSAPADMLDSQPGTLMLTDCIDMCRKNRSCMAVNYETGLCVLFSSNADMYPVLEELMSWFYEIKDLFLCSQYSFYAYTRPHAHYTPTSSAMSVTGESHSSLSIRPSLNRHGRSGNDRGPTQIPPSDRHGLRGETRPTVPAASSDNDRTFSFILRKLYIKAMEMSASSANFNNATGDCQISDMDRHTTVGTGAFKVAENSDFLENNCVDDPVRLCEFQRMEGRILKTVDSVFQDVESLEDCKRLCLTAPFRCYSFDFGDTGDKVCRLSHHSAATLTHIEEPYLEIAETATYELSSCYNVTIDCRSGDMVAKIKTSKIFNGKIYAKGSPNTCVNDIENALEFELQMTYNDIDCDVERDSASRYSNDVVIQHHDMIVTSADLGLRVHCQYDLTNKSVSNRVDLNVEEDLSPVMEEGSTVDSPNVIMRVTNRNGDDISDASVGDMLQLRFEIVDRNSPYEIFVRDLVAMDGGNTKNLTLLDGRGCPTEISIMRPLLKVDSTGKVLGATFDAFKFPTSDVVQFRALVTPCLPTCEPVVCDVMDFGGQVKQAESYGRKKRAISHMTMGDTALASPFSQDYTIISPYSMSVVSHPLQRVRREAEQEIPEELLVVQSIKISDKFAFRGAQTQSRDSAANSNRKETVTATDGDPELVLQEDVSGVCINMVGLVLACSVFLVAQLVIIVAWTAVWHRRRRSKLEEPLSPATTTESLRQLYDSGYPRRI